MKCIDGNDIVALAATLAVKVAEDMSEEELCTLIEFLSLFRSNLDIIKCNRRRDCKKCK